MQHRKGDLIRWDPHYSTFIGGLTSNDLRGRDPIYKYGIIVEVSEVEPESIVVYCINCKQIKWAILNNTTHALENLSGDADE